MMGKNVISRMLFTTLKDVRIGLIRCITPVKHYIQELTIAKERASTVYVCCWFARVAVTKFQKLGGFDSRNVSSHGGGGQKSAVKVWAGLAPPEGWAEEPVPCLSPSCRGCWQFLVSIGLQLPNFSLHMVCSLCCLCTNFSFL